MHVLEVLPLSTLPPQVPQILSYYHENTLPKGAVVEVSMNNRIVTAVVVDSYDLEEQKIMVKKSLFQLKKIDKVLSSEPAVSERQFKIALWLAQRYVASLGLSLKAVLPPFFMKPKYPIKPKAPLPADVSSPQALWIICRAKHTDKQIRSFLKNNIGQTLVIVPDATYLEYFKEKLAEYSPEVLTSGSSNKDYYRIWNGVENNKIQLILGTRQALFLPFAKLQRVIVIDPLHEFYKSDLSPRYWTPELAEMIAENNGARFIAFSSLLGVEGQNKLDRAEIQVSDSMKPWSARITTIDMAAEFKLHYIGIFAPETKEAITTTIENKGRVLILAARRGYSGILLCLRCGYSFKCPDCDLPMRLHQNTEIILMCHHCNRTQPYAQSCPNCHSSQVKPTGPAGSQKIFEELNRMMTHNQCPRVPVLILDTDTTTNETEEEQVMKEIANPSFGNSGSVLISTQKIFSHSYAAHFDTVIIPQLDSLSVGADFQTTERLWHQLEKIADFEPDNIVVQTFHQKDLPQTLAEHNYEKLYRSELDLRKAFLYPPYCRMVKLTYSNADWRKVSAAARAAVEKLKIAALHINARDRVFITETSPLFMRKEKGLYQYSIIIKIPKEFNARDLLRYVPAPWLIDIDPRTIV